MTAEHVHAWLRIAEEAYGGDLPLPRGRGGLPTLRPEPITAESAPGPSPTPARTPEPPTLAPALEPAAGDDRDTRLAELRANVLPCQRCKLAATRTQVVFGEGDPRARVMFIGEAPGFHEDQQGRPFVGAAGQLLDRIVANAMGLARAAVYIANVNKCRPPDNREPEPDEVAACLPFLRAQVQIIRPEVIVCLGRVASANLLGTSLPMRALRGRALAYEGIPVVVTWHPAYLLRNPAAKRETWDDIKRVNRLLGLPEVPGATAAGTGGD